MNKFHYKVNNFQIIELEYSYRIVIEGYAFLEKSLDVNFHLMVNNKIVDVDMNRYFIEDIFNENLDKLVDSRAGFYVDVTFSERPDSLLFFAKYSNTQTVLLRLSDKEINQFISKFTVLSSVESCSILGRLVCFNGYAFDIKSSSVNFSVLENGKNIDFSYRKITRRDLINRNVITKENIWCGFQIQFEYNSGKKYELVLENKSGFINIPLQIKPGYVNAYQSHLFRNEMLIHFENGLRILKKRGIKGIIERIKNGPIVNTKYHYWMLANQVSIAELEEQRKMKFEYNPKISIIVATFNTPLEYLKEMIDTVLMQSYQNLELCIGDGSTTDDVRKYIEENYNDSRIKYKRLEKNYGISGNMNGALELATGDYVGLYDHDDILELDALYEIVNRLQNYKYDVIYTDEDKLDNSTKKYVDPNFKPDYNVDLLRSHNYITHFFVVNMNIVKKIGGMRSEFDGSQDYDFIFRCIENSKAICHVPKILYHWRMHDLSTAQNPESKMYCYEAGKKAIECHYQRIGVDASVEMMPKPLWGLYRTNYHLYAEPLVSIIIPNMNNRDTLKKCIESLYNVNTYHNFEIIVVENNSTENSIFEYYKILEANYSNIRICYWKENGFNYSALNNFGVKNAKGDYLLFLNNDTELILKDSIREMVSRCQEDDVGIVGSKLLYEDETIQHAGVVVGFSGYAGHVFCGHEKNSYGFMMQPIINCNYSAVTAACLLMKKSIFNEVGGFDENFKVACNDVDLCLKVRRLNKLVVYDPFSLWYHYESKSRGYENTLEKVKRFDAEVRHFQEKWNDILENGDPYYNNNFDYTRSPYTL